MHFTADAILKAVILAKEGARPSLWVSSGSEVWEEIEMKEKKINVEEIFWFFNLKH